MKPIYNQSENSKWWSKKRLKYNKGLVIAGTTAFLAYAILGSILIAPHDIDFEITLFTISFQAIGYLVMMCVANVFYYLGPFVDKHFNSENDSKFRERLFNLGYWFSFALPFLIPISIIFIYLFKYA